MSRTVIDVNSLSKKYRLGLRETKSDTFVGSLTKTLTAPFRNYRQIRDLSRMDGDGPGIFWALRDISFQVKEGDVLGVIGHNGAGKSTLLKILANITHPTSGEAVIQGVVSSLLEVGTGFHPELTGRENVYMNGTILGMRKKEIDRKFDEIVEFSGIEKHIDTVVKFYSSGMKVRLGFAVAAHLQADILIIDEILAVGDAEFQRKCLGKMENASHQGRTVLFVSHNMEAVRSLCSRAILLSNGIMELDGEVNLVINKYLSKHRTSVLKKVFEWEEAPGTESIRLLGAELIPDSGSDQLDVDTGFQLIFDLALKNDLTSFSLSLVLRTLSGSCIFNVGTIVLDLKQGKSRSILTIPGGLLNDDVYAVELFFVQDSSKVLFRYDDVLTFEISDVPRKGNWFGKWIGAVRPKLEFTLT